MPMFWKIFVIKVFPDPIPPVSPTINIREELILVFYYTMYYLNKIYSTFSGYTFTIRT